METLLKLDQTVVGLDNLSTGYQHNLDEVMELVIGASNGAASASSRATSAIWRPAAAAAGVDFVLHQAALGSVPRSLQDPIATNDVNIDGFLNMLVAARDARGAWLCLRGVQFHLRGSPGAAQGGIGNRQPLVAVCGHQVRE